MKPSYATVIPFACYHTVTTAGQGTDLSHLAERPSRLARNKLYREIYGEQLHSKARQGSSSSPFPSQFLSFLSSRTDPFGGSFDLNSNANLGHLSISIADFPVVRRTTRNYRYIQNFVPLSFLSGRNRPPLCACKSILARVNETRGGK